CNGTVKNVDTYKVQKIDANGLIQSTQIQYKVGDQVLGIQLQGIVTTKKDNQVISIFKTTGFVGVNTQNQIVFAKDDFIADGVIYTPKNKVSEVRVVDSQKTIKLDPINKSEFSTTYTGTIVHAATFKGAEQ